MDELRSHAEERESLEKNILGADRMMKKNNFFD